MAKGKQNDYSPGEALSLLLALVEKASSLLANEIRERIDEGIDESESATNKELKSESRGPRALSDNEALSVALRVLEAYFITLPECINSASKEINSCFSARDGQGDRTTQGEDEEDEVLPQCALQIDAASETRKLGKGKSEVLLKVHSSETVEEQKKNFATLRKLLRID